MATKKKQDVEEIEVAQHEEVAVEQPKEEVKQDPGHNTRAFRQ